MQTISAIEAAEQLGVNPHTIFTYLKSGRLGGDYATGDVDGLSLLAYRKRLVPDYDAISQVLMANDLTDRQRDILTRRVLFQTLEEIGAAIDPPVTRSRVAAIIRRLLGKD